MESPLITSVKQEACSNKELNNDEETSSDSNCKLQEITDVKENFTPIQHKFDPRVIEFLKGTKSRKKKLKQEPQDVDMDWEPPYGLVADPIGETDDGGEEMRKEFEIEILDCEMIRSKKGKLVTYKCSVCGKFYSANPRAKGFFVKHKLTHMIGTINGMECEQCGNKFESKKELSRHTRMVHNGFEGEEGFNPMDIGGSFPQIDVPWSELKQYVTKEEKFIQDHKIMYRCSICGEEKCGYENFLGHKLRHADKFCFSCKHCGRGFYRKTDGKRHEEKATCLFGKRSPFIKIRGAREGTMKNFGFLKPSEVKKEDGRKWFECCICERAMAGYETFIAHKFDHAGIRPYKCDGCTTEFGRKSDWKKHILSTKCVELYSDMYSGKAIRLEKAEAAEGANPEDCNNEENEIDMSFTLDIGDKNRERITAAIRILETATYPQLMENLDLAQAGVTKIFVDNEDTALSAAASTSLQGGEGTSTVDSGLENQRAMIFNKESQGLYQYVGQNEKVKAEDSDDVWFKCSICTMTFQCLTTFAVHKRKHLQVKPYKCVYCKKSFTRKWDLTSHMRTHKQVAKPKCNDCDKVFTSISQLKKHFEISTDCTMSEELQHMTDKGRDSHQCDICFKSYTSPFYLQAHRLTHTESNLTCELCGQTFAISKNLAIHMMRHKGEKNFACDICGKRFVRNSDVTSHMVTHSEEKNQVCPICNKRFKHKNSLRSHMMLHSDTKPYLCNECGRAFVQKGNLKKHQKETHATEYNYKCELCDKYFYTDGGHRIHMKSHHSIERPHKCCYCDKSFVTRMNLARHIATHTDSRPHNCPECHRSFRMVSHIRRHLMTVHGWSKEQVMELKLKEISAQELAKITSMPLTPEQISSIEAKKLRSKVHVQPQQPSLVSTPKFILINQAPDGSTLVKEENEEVITEDSINPEMINTIIDQSQQQVVVVDEHGRQLELPEGFVIAEGQQMELVQVQGEEVIDDIQAQQGPNTIFVYR